jgi:hypothetical protein
VFFRIDGGEIIIKNSTEKANDDKDATFKFKKEQLDISKDWVQTGDVNIYKESSIVDKIFTVPVENEYLVIEKKSLPHLLPRIKILQISFVYPLAMKKLNSQRKMLL